MARFDHSETACQHFYLCYQNIKYLIISTAQLCTRKIHVCQNGTPYYMTLRVRVSSQHKRSLGDPDSHKFAHYQNTYPFNESHIFILASILDVSTVLLQRFFKLPRIWDVLTVLLQLFLIFPLNFRCSDCSATAVWRRQINWRPRQDHIMQERYFRNDLKFGKYSNHLNSGVWYSDGYSNIYFLWPLIFDFQNGLTFACPVIRSDYLITRQGWSSSRFSHR